MKRTKWFKGMKLGPLAGMAVSFFWWVPVLIAAWLIA